MTGVRAPLLSFAASFLLVAAGCGGADTVPSATAGSTTAASDTIDAPAETTTPPPTVETSVATTAAPPTTTTPPAPTSAPGTTAATSTTAPTPTSTVAGAPTTPPPATALVVVDAALVEVDVATGSVIRTIDEYFAGDGVFRGGLRRSPDGATMWFSEGYEDSWYSCESSVGAIGSLDLATGAPTSTFDGESVALSADGGTLAYSVSDVCVPDPEAPEFWVLTPANRVVVRQLGSGAETAFVSEPTPDAYDSLTTVSWVGFADDGSLLVLTADGALRRVDPSGSTTVQDHPVVLDSLLGYPVGTLAGRIVTNVPGDEGSSDVFAIDLATGSATPLASSETFMAIGISDLGHVVVASSTPVTVHAGGLVTVLAVDGDPFVADVDW